MKETIINLIENESENTKLDFKLEQYPIEKGGIKKGEFLKDMCAFANLISEEDKFIIIGVEERNGVASDFKSIDKLHDQAFYQQFLNQYIEPEINFEYKEIIHKENRLAYFRLFNNNQTPYLFKKEYKDTQPKGNQYRIGTGFIRTGTSTRELKREDFEKIYSERLGRKDRSNEIDFELAFGGFKSSELKDTIYRHLQVDIINLSNASIDIDVEAKIFNNEGVTAQCTQDLEYKMYNNRRDKSMFAYIGNLDKVIPPYVLINTNVKFEYHGAFSTYEVVPKNGAHAAVRVKQKGKEANIFNDQIALVFSKPASLEIELIVRNDDFPSGPKIFSYSFPKEQTAQLLDPWDL